MIRSPLLSMGLFFLVTGVLIIIFPHLLQILVAVALIFLGLSLISIDRVRKGKGGIRFHMGGKRGRDN